MALLKETSREKRESRLETIRKELPQKLQFPDIPNLSADELAVAWDVSTRHVYELRLKGIIKPLKVGGALRFAYNKALAELEAHNASRA